MDIEEILAEIRNEYQCRDVQINQMFHYINLPLTHNIIAYGPRSTCKTSLIRAIVNKLKLFNVYIDLNSSNNKKNIYEAILRRTLKELVQLGCDTSGLLPNTKCSNSVIFTEKLETLLIEFSNFSRKNWENEFICYHKFIIVLDSIEALFEQENDEFVYIINNLETLLKNVCPISVIYISKNSLESMNRKSDFKMSSLQIIFNNYSNDELRHLLTRRAIVNELYSDEFYSK